MASLKTIGAAVLTQWRVAALGLAFFLVTAVFARYLWREWTVFAMVGVFSYVMSGRYVFPWSTPWRRAVAIGVFFGILFSTIEFFYNPIFT